MKLLARAWQYLTTLLWELLGEGLCFVLPPMYSETGAANPFDPPNSCTVQLSPSPPAEQLLQNLFDVSHRPDGIALRTNDGTYEQFKTALDAWLRTCTRPTTVSGYTRSGVTSLGRSEAVNGFSIHHAGDYHGHATFHYPTPEDHASPQSRL